MKKEYYKSENGLEVKDVLQNDHTRFTEREAFYFGNIIKYITRAGRKEENINESLDKAKEYYKYIILEHYYISENDRSMFKKYIKARIKSACLALGAVENYNIFSDTCLVYD